LFFHIIFFVISYLFYLISYRLSFFNKDFPAVLGAKLMEKRDKTK